MDSDSECLLLYSFLSDSDSDCLFLHSFPRHARSSMASSNANCVGVDDFKILYNIKYIMVSFHKGLDLSTIGDEGNIILELCTADEKGQHGDTS